MEFGPAADGRRMQQLSTVVAQEAVQERVRHLRIRPSRQLEAAGFFSFLYLKKLKFQKYMAVSKNFKTIPLSPPGWATERKCKKKLHLGPSTRDALNSELVKSI